MVVQTLQGVVPLSHRQNSQDNCYMEPQKLPIQGTNLISAVPIENLLSKLHLPTLVVIRGGARTTPLGPREEEVEDVKSPSSSEESLQFQELNKTAKETTKETKAKKSKVNNPADLYDLWKDLACVKLVENPYLEEEQSVHFLEAIPIIEESSDSFCWNMATLVEEVEEKEALRFEIDDTQLEEFKALMQDEDIQLPLNFKKTSSGIQVGHTLSIYSSVSKDWYHGSTNHVHVCSSDWQEIDMALKRKEPKLIKIGSHLTHEEEIQEDG
uniref:Predicted protein n=1 Tax=Physcomitrium patens TaxID=3218 RepID=A9U5L8_PHYPA